MTIGLATKARSAVIWNTGFNLFRDLLQFGTMLALVRMLKPENYGEFAMVTSVVGVLSVFSHSNFIAHILQVKGETDARYQEHFTAGSVIQIGMFLVTNLIALVLNWAPTYAPVAPYLHVMSITFLLEWPCELRRKMIERDFDWKRLRLLQASGLIVGALLALVMAWAGAGTYALIVPGMLVTLPFIYDLFVVERWRPTWSWSWALYRPAWRFGLARTGSGIVGSGRQLLESGVLTAVVGFAALGVFGRAIGLAQMFCNKFAFQLMYAIYPVLTRIDARADGPSQVGGLVLRVVAWAVLPIAVVFAELAEPVVRVVYGSQWEAVTPLLPWAMAWGALSALNHTAYMLLLAKRQTVLCLYSDLCVLVGTVTALAVALPRGLTVYLFTVISFLVIVSGLLTFSLKKFHVVLWREVVDAFVPPLLAGLVAWGVLRLLISRFYAGQEYSVIGAIAWGAAFWLLYLFVIRVGFTRQLIDLVRYFPARRSISRFLILKTQS